MPCHHFLQQNELYTPNNLQLFTCLNWDIRQPFIKTLLAADVGSCHPVSKMCTAKSGEQKVKRDNVEHVMVLHFPEIFINA